MKKLTIFALNAILLLGVSACSGESKGKKDADNNVKTNVPGVRDRDRNDDDYRGRPSRRMRDEARTRSNTDRDYYDEYSQDEISMSSNRRQDTRMSDSYAAIEAEIDATRPYFPLELDLGMYATDMYIDGSDFVTVTEMDESYYDLDNLDTYSAKQVMMDSMFSDPQQRTFAQNCKAVGLNMVYIYRGSHSGKTRVIRINVNEL